jgi:hypothetical protein
LSSHGLIPLAHFFLYCEKLQQENKNYTGPANLVGPLQGKQLSDLIALLQNGQAYVNVHTEQNPNGEIRGTIEVDND